MIEQNIETLKELRQKYQSIVTELNKTISSFEVDKYVDQSELEAVANSDIAFRDLANTLKRIKFHQSVELASNKSKAKAMLTLDKQNQGGNNGNGNGNNNNNNNGNGRP